MGKIGLVVNYDGHWDGAQFMGSSPFAICVTTEVKHDQLLEKIYQRVGVNRDRFGLKLSAMANTKTGKKILPIMYDGDVEFVLINAECILEIFVEAVERPVAALETPGKARPMHGSSFSKDAGDTAGGENGKEGVGKPKPDADKTTFWTCCSSCGIKYQYHRTHVNKVLRCQSCQQSFTAYDLGSREISSAHPWNRSLNQNGVPNPVFQNGFLNPGPSKVPSRSNHGNSSAMAQEKVDGRMKGMEGVRMHKPDVENGKEGVGKPSECGTSRNADKKRKRKSEGESRESYEAGNGSELSNASEEGVQEVDPELLKYPDPEFSDFDIDRAESCFAVNQVWAIYDTCDSMPRYYAQIEQVFSPGFKLQITWLEPDPDDEGENDWCDVDLPVACGKFMKGLSAQTKDLLLFSHQVSFIRDAGRNSCLIYPDRGETWALFRDWDIKWNDNPEEHQPPYQYEFVEVLTDFKVNVGIGVAYLGKVKGFLSVFQ